MPENSLQPEPTPTITVTPTPPQDDMTSYAVKMLVAVVLGPKISPLMVSLGVPLDPVMMSVLIGGALHKLHQILKAQTGWTFL